MSFEKRILVVDDDEKLAGLFQAVLSARGYKTEVAFTGGEALKLIEDFHPELILLDIGLPDVSGLEILRRAKSGPAQKCDAYVILITGSSGIEMKIEGFHTGASDYVSKPIDTRELLLKVDRVFKTISAQKEQINLTQKETLQTLVQSMAHELTAPLAAIRNEVRLQLMEPVAEDLRNRLNRIEAFAQSAEGTLIKFHSSVRMVSKEPVPGIRLIDLNESAK